MKIKNQILIKKYLESKNYDDALSEIKENLKFEPDDPYLNYYMARTLCLLDRCNEALRPLKKALTFDSRNCDISILAAEIFTKMKYYVKAEEFYLYILKYYPDNPEILAGYAYLKALTGDFKGSELLIGKAIEKDPENIRVITSGYKISQITGNISFRYFLSNLSPVDVNSQDESHYSVDTEKRKAGFFSFL